MRISRIAGLVLAGLVAGGAPAASGPAWAGTNDDREPAVTMVVIEESRTGRDCPAL